ncbi:MAG: hypothetical protein A2X05_04150 [Bacteroidetes bacterium GWE2_41_25]|nr:MAG: hypothetical protein A2X03_01140 [Bacteroidetes bacterium GWA2_40_15]OFX94550.1 MAG: hypothetical protein A2X05_04150 [Bacteroidetes bacterium GWE2_41_25]OFX96821.1 MAG: hypothetical protein A2X06_11820 [Bacteroidetes bacterium GWC2_40_22]OFY59097.1 MAG: hypothetical protein A2X04_13740 [Bacteroidetes bacterium GWF2_41_9]HAM11028.1 DUF4440 domain-containing protein [Bacteroidales bacterium]
MKKYIFVIVFLFTVSLSSYSQTAAEKEVASAVENLMKGFIDADKNILDNMTAEELNYGHSAGKVQNKTEFVDEVISGKPLDYLKIDLEGQTIKVTGKTAVVRHIFNAETSSNGTPGKLRIGNMMVWQKQKGKWKLIARQAYKLP